MRDTAPLENTPRAWAERSLATTSWEAALWSEAGQTQRFLAVLRHLELREGDTVLDFGCGTGRFSAFLPETVDYYCYDWSEEMRDRASLEHRRARVLEQIPEQLFDHVIVIGVFNLASGWSKERTWSQLRDLWVDAVRRTFVVSLYRGEDPSCLRYSEAEACKFALSLGCSSFAVDATYLRNDLLLEMRR